MPSTDALKPQTFPAPDISVGANCLETQQRDKTIASRAQQYRPVNASEQGLSCTLARYAGRLIDRETGKAYSADELVALAIGQAAPNDGKAYVAINGTWIQAVHDGAPTAGSNAVASSYETNLTGANNDLTFTAATAGAAGDDITITYVDPAAPNEAIDVSVTGTAITVSLATGDGDNATTTITCTGDDIEIEYDTAGAAGNSAVIDVVAPTITNGFGDNITQPSYDGPTCSGIGDGYIALLPTDGGQCGVIQLQESSASAGNCQIWQKPEYAGLWGNHNITASISFSGVSQPFGVVCTESNGALDIAITLATDTEGLPVAKSDTDLAAAINTALETVNGTDDWTDYLVAVAGTRQIDSFTAAGTATSGGNITVTVTATSWNGGVGANVVVALDGNETPAMWAHKVRLALNDDATVGADFYAEGNGADVRLVRITPAADDATEITVVDTGATGITAVAGSDNVVAGVAAGGDFDTVFEFYEMDGGNDSAAIPCSASDIETAISGALSGATVTQSGTGLYTAGADTYTFSGGGDNAAITTVASEIKTAIEADAEADALVVVTNKSGNNGTGVVTAMSVQSLAGGADNVTGTIGWVGRTATDGTDVWTCMVDNMDGETPTAWVKTFTATP